MKKYRNYFLLLNFCFIPIPVYASTGSNFSDIIFALFVEGFFTILWVKGVFKPLSNTIVTSDNRLFFNSISDCARYFGCSVSNISLRLEDGQIGRRGITRGFLIDYFNGNRSTINKM